MKYIFVSGGVVSGLGKGVVTASLAFLLKSRGFKVIPTKVDMYFNVDAGTLRPQEHGEVFVTHDGMETDEDLGHYERFTHQNLKKENYITAGQIYSEVIRRERAFDYGGETVDVIPHITDEIVRKIALSGTINNADIVVVEYGGTVGEYKNGIFFEASRILKLKHPKDVIHVHVTYLPFLAHIGELKSKPAQTSVHILNGLGIQPDVIVARSEKPLDNKRMDKLALYCNISPDRLFSAPNLDTIYQVPVLFHKPQHHFATTCLKLLGLSSRKHKNMKEWQTMTKHAVKKWPQTVRIAMVGKYFVTGNYSLVDSYVSVVESLRHAAWKIGVNLTLDWIDSETLEKTGTEKLKNFDGVVVPQGWGSRGTEGKIMAIKFARENNIPYFGLCFGMQMAVIEFARNVLKMHAANSTEVNPKTKYPVIHIMPGQKAYLAKKQYGGTIRLGAWPTLLTKKSKIYELYSNYGGDKNSPWFQPNPNQKALQHTSLASSLVYERHRHRYEFNTEYKKMFEKHGMLFSGMSPDGLLVEAIELPSKKFFIGTQYHPEYVSRPLTPHPLFLGFIRAASK